MTAGSYDIIVEQYADFQLPIIWQNADGTPINITGYDADMMVRDATEALIYELSKTNGRITLGGTNGVITLNIPNAQTATMPVGTFYYDLVLTDTTGFKTRLLEGAFAVREGDTHP